MTYSKEIIEKYKKLNMLIKNGGTVFFGADWLYNICDKTGCRLTKDVLFYIM